MSKSVSAGHECMGAWVSRSWMNGSLSQQVMNEWEHESVGHEWAATWVSRSQESAGTLANRRQELLHMERETDPRVCGNYLAQNKPQYFVLDEMIWGYTGLWMTFQFLNGFQDLRIFSNYCFSIFTVFCGSSLTTDSSVCFPPGLPTFPP